MRLRKCIIIKETAILLHLAMVSLTTAHWKTGWLWGWLWRAWFDNLDERFSYTEVQFKMFLWKPSCHVTGNNLMKPQTCLCKCILDLKCCVNICKLYSKIVRKHLVPWVWLPWATHWHHHHNPVYRPCWDLSLLLPSDLKVFQNKHVFTNQSTAK